MTGGLASLGCTEGYLYKVSFTQESEGHLAGDHIPSSDFSAVLRSAVFSTCVFAFLHLRSMRCILFWPYPVQSWEADLGMLAGLWELEEPASSLAGLIIHLSVKGTSAISMLWHFSRSIPVSLWEMKGPGNKVGGSDRLVGGKSPELMTIFQMEIEWRFDGGTKWVNPQGLEA